MTISNAGDPPPDSGQRSSSDFSLGAPRFRELVATRPDCPLGSSEMARPAWTLLLALVLVVFGGIRLFLGLPLLVAPSVGLWTPVAFLVQAVAAGLLAAGLWLGRSWTLFALAFFVAVMAASVLIEGFVMGIRPTLQAIAIAALAVIGGVIVARALRDPAAG
jgi:hypothetical protein